jgi:hypothetical protein
MRSGAVTSSLHHMQLGAADMPGLQAKKNQVRRETTSLRELHPIEKDMLRLPAATPERKTVRGDQDRPEAPCRRGSGCDTATYPGARAAPSSTSREVSTASYAALDASRASCYDDATPPLPEYPFQ